MVESPGAGSMYLLVAMCFYTPILSSKLNVILKKISNRQPESQSLRKFLDGVNKGINEEKLFKFNIVPY